MSWNQLKKRLSNAGTILSLVSLVVLLLTTNGVQVDSERVMTSVKIICSIGTILGLFNNPDTPGMDLPGRVKDNSEYDGDVMYEE